MTYKLKNSSFYLNIPKIFTAGITIKSLSG
jgi:hypothetical protein